ncbi:hypothetical protein ELH24_09755 [Rhizobium ruizarguesonis]|uniref:hypothetical protein n=1 Tax=Rhizobium ruizarguesonis TaxID=2081791 RepID=UPI00102FE84F|nr:hypothetical protein [Rhizobium ruizarguesonis]TBC98937.1 hypothetical protein ELH25_09695 [Rhizobium ruizarguesonis]TBD15791.1 hypothetical protein ELH24_09755 [Rhizobium ruizarguesonis]TBD27707.1 hypothetical protein ELH20_09040 [Rhizobium ruizarguesonis]TBE96804.1 hypothetical protein ELG98_09505 [Rhizobium ruizarguesonis]
MNTDSRVAFTQHLYADLSKKIESFVADEKVGQSFAVAKGVAFDPNSVPAAAGNRAIMLFNLYARYYALKQQSDGLISDRDWIEITNLLCGTLKDPPYTGSLAYLRSKNGTTSVSDAQTPGQPGAEGSRNQNGAKDIQTSQSSRGETEDALGDKALQQLETCKP